MGDEDLPHVVWEGTMTIGDWTIQVANLSNGQRVMFGPNIEAFMAEFREAAGLPPVEVKG
jgi:hypothetical protein